jgi:starch synthase
MKGAIYAADYVTTVSPTYASELQYAFYAHGLEGVVAANYGKISGILNGIDTDVYNPQKDTTIAASFSPDDLSGKAKCKAELQKRLGLNQDPDVPIVAIVSRLAGHKGFELITSQFNRLMEQNIQFVLLGTGEWGYEQFFRDAANRYPGRVSSNLMYSANLSSAIYAGADIYLMPSISEPCGLSQMIAMRYGTIPVVRETGGLRDSVTPYSAEHPDGRGFTFANINGDEMLAAVGQAVELYTQKPEEWQKLMTQDMQIDFSWNVSAGAYEAIYQKIVG